MKLTPGSQVPEHIDAEGWVKGIVRLHIPIITNDDVFFKLNGIKLPMKEGEMWYTDVTNPHSVGNNSDETRIHLVIDLAINKWVYDFFPKEGLYDQFKTYVYRKRPIVLKKIKNLRF